MSRCSNQSCQIQPIVFCSCNNQTYYWCENDYFNHTQACPHELHSTQLLKPINSEAHSSLLNKIIEVKLETEKIIVEVNAETEKSVQEHSRIIKKALKANKRLTKEMDSIVNQCEKIIKIISEPVINKSFYSPLEYILINDISKSEHIINEIQPPKIVDIQLVQGLWEKVKIKTSFFSYLLNTYSAYSIYVKNESDGHQAVVRANRSGSVSYMNHNIEHHSRFLFVSPHEIMITGGKKAENENQCLLLDTENNQFSSKPSLNVGRYWHSCVLFKGCPVVIGGHYQSDALSSVEMLEFDRWKVMPSIKNPRWSGAASCVFDKIFLFGGNFKKPVVEVFYEAKNDWEEIDIEISYRISPGVIGLYGDNLLIFGGKAGDNFINEVVKADLDSGKLSKMNALPYGSSHPYNCYSITDNNFFHYVFTNIFGGSITWGFEEEISFN